MAFPRVAGLGGGGGGGDAQMGLSSLLLPFLLSMGPGMLAKLFGGDPQEKLRSDIARLLGQQGSKTDEFYRQAISSPAYSQAQGTIAAGANQSANQIGQSLAARGLGTTGTGAVLSGLTPSLLGSQQAKLRTEAHTGAQQQTENWLRQRIAALTGTQGPSQSAQMFAGGLEAFSPFLQAYFKSKYPGSLQTQNVA